MIRDFSSAGKYSGERCVLTGAEGSGRDVIFSLSLSSEEIMLPLKRHYGVLAGSRPRVAYAHNTFPPPPHLGVTQQLIV